MREVYYNSDLTDKSINEIKILSLYYDKIHIINDSVYSPKFEVINNEFKSTGINEFELIPKTFSLDYKVLIDENIISIQNKDEKNNDNLFATEISKIVNSKFNLIFPNHPTEKDSKIITKEVYEIMKNMWGFEWGKPVESNLIWWYYSLKLQSFLKLLIDGKTCISSSNNLNLLFNSFIVEHNKSYNKLITKGEKRSLAFEALKFKLPNPDVLSFEEVLELKIKLKDELENFHETMNLIEVKNKNILNGEITEKEYQAFFYEHIKKPLRELDIKIKNLNSNTFGRFIDNIQNYKTYVPILGTVALSGPTYYSLLCSMGLTVGQSILEYKKEKREIENNGLYFLMKLK